MMYEELSIRAMLRSLCCQGMPLKRKLLVLILIASGICLISLATIIALDPGMHDTNVQSRWIVVLIYPVALCTFTGAACVAVDHRAVTHWEQPQLTPAQKEVQRVWASEVFGSLESSRLAFFSHSARRGPTAEWENPTPAPWLTATPVPAKTCLCCLDDFEDANKVAILPCGHIFHEACQQLSSLVGSHLPGTPPKIEPF